MRRQITNYTARIMRILAAMRTFREINVDTFVATTTARVLTDNSYQPPSIFIHNALVSEISTWNETRSYVLVKVLIILIVLVVPLFLVVLTVLRLLCWSNSSHQPRT